MAEIKINVADSAYNKDVARGSLGAATVQPYSKETAAMAKDVEALDRYDDFSSLQIESSTYKKKKGSDYGIEVKMGVNNDVILTHQREAATKFLKELRGFGLLADVVGSGKTFEACVILSELAVRGNVRSLLLVVPEQVYRSWKNVLEEQFGLGKDVLLDAGEDVYAAMENAEVKMEHVDGNISRPLRPIIVTTENFVKWSESCKQLLFDVIIVDEAHNLCTEEGEYARAMKLLSLMMQTKKAANSTYCILLSATPHSGNLENMFRLWYFIRCKGGNPSDFDEKDDTARTIDYRNEKQYYKDHICRGATTVMEFIQKVKMAEVTQLDEEAKIAFTRWLKTRGVTNFDSFTEGEKLSYVNEFLSKDEQKTIKNRVMQAIAGAYHNGVLRSIMIRQPNNGLSKKKKIVNYLFFPMSVNPEKTDIRGLREETVTVNYADLCGNNAIINANGGYSVHDYVERYVKENGGSYNYSFAELMVSKILGKKGLNPSDNKYFTKENTQRYYWEQIEASPKDSGINVIPFNAENYSSFDCKLERTKQILKEHTGRVLIFFDYEKQEKDIFENRVSTVERLIAELKKEDAFKERILDKTAKTDDKKTTEEQFNADEHDDAILIVKDKAFTEGANLQKSNVIINFEVPSDPLAMDQRIGRIFRLGQQNDVTVYSLADMSQLEGYVLMYFTRIGLMSSNSGDATIIAGSNNERMVTVRCEVCGNVKLYSQEEYEERRKNGKLYCRETERCRQTDSRGTIMQEITVSNFKCDVCGQVFERSATEEGYKCVSKNNGRKGIMCSEGNRGDRSFYCRKICAISNCSLFKTGALKGKCNALKMYERNKNVSDCELKECCEMCRYKDNGLCPEECRVETGIDGIRACMDCDKSECSPKPHVIKFDDSWFAECPVCGKRGIDGKYGKLKPVQARTFDAYIRGAWEFKHDGGASFCTNFGKEADKVSEIKKVLELDKSI